MLELIPLPILLLITVGIVALIFHRYRVHERAYGRTATWVGALVFAIALMTYGGMVGDPAFYMLALAALVGTSYEYREWKRRRRPCTARPRA